MELAWFKTPTDGDEGTLNLAYNAVDVRVIRGGAADPAVVGEASLDFAGLLEQSGALAGAMRGLGVQPDQHVGVLLTDPLRELLVLLASARLGATCVVLENGRLDEFAPHLVVTDTALDPGEHTPAAAILSGIEPSDETREVAWDIAVKAGRTDPAGCEPVAPSSIAFVLDEPVPIASALADPSRFGTALAALVAGRPVTLGGAS